MSEMSERPSFRARVEAEYKPAVLKFVLEKFIPPVKFKTLENPSYDIAQQLNSEGRWLEAGSHLMTLAGKVEAPELQVSYLTEAAQMAINLGRFGQARGILRRAELSAQAIPIERRKISANAAISEKSGWINDYEADFRCSLGDFSNARDLIEEIPQNERTGREADILSTADHFSGRVHLGLALQGVDRESNIKAAISFFERDSERYRKIRGEGRPSPLNEWFQEAWLTRCDVALGDIDGAGKRLLRSRVLLDEFLATNASGGVEAHYHLLSGGVAMKGGKVREARIDFEKALEIRVKDRVEGKPYPKGESDALLGVSATYWADGKIGVAAYYAAKAFKTYPFFLVRPSI